MDATTLIGLIEDLRKAMDAQAQLETQLRMSRSEWGLFSYAPDELTAKGQAKQTADHLTALRARVADLQTQIAPAQIIVNRARDAVHAAEREFWGPLYDVIKISG